MPAREVLDCDLWRWWACRIAAHALRKQAAEGADPVTFTETIVTDDE